jgi:hypothetical protein
MVLYFLSFFQLRFVHTERTILELRSSVANGQWYKYLSEFIYHVPHILKAFCLSSQQSVEIKTDSGQRVKVRPPSPDAATAAEMSMDSHTPLHATIGLNATSMFTPFNADLGECSTTEASMALIDPASLLRPLPVANSDNPTGTLDSNREDEAAADEYDDYEDEHSAEAGEPVSLSLRRGDISMLRQSLQQDNLADAIKVEKTNSAEVKQSDIAEEADESETVQACADVLQSMAVENNDAGVSEPDGPSSLDSSFVSHVLPKLSALDQNKRKFLMDVRLTHYVLHLILSL